MIRPTPRTAFAGAVLAYLAWTIVLCHGLLDRFATALPSDLGDPLLNSAILAWNSRHLPLTADWWQFPIFAPVADVTAFTEHLLGAWPMASTVMWVTGNPFAAYNAVFVGSFPFGAVAMYALAWALTGDVLASLVAGFAFGFPLYAAVQVSHLQVLITGWMPLTLLGLHKWLSGGRWWWLAVAGASWLMTALTNAYYLVFFGVFLAAWFLYFGVRRRAVARAVVAGVVLVAALAPMVPLLATYVRVHQAYGFFRDLDEVRWYSADVLDLFAASWRSNVWGQWLAPDPPKEAELFPGIALVMFAAASILARCRPAAASRALTAPPYDSAIPTTGGLNSSHDQQGGHARWAASALSIVRHTLLATVLAAVAGGMWTAHAGAWRTSLLGIRLSLTRPERGFTVAVVALLAWVALSPRLARGWRTGGPIVFYVLGAWLTWSCTLGPTPTLGGQPFLAHGPYAWLMLVPGGDAVRVPARFWVVTLLCLSVLAAFGARAIIERLPPRAGHAVVLCLLGLMLAESRFRISYQLLPRNAAASDVIGAGAMVLDVPIGRSPRDLQVVYRTVVNGNRTVNGYSGYFPAHYTALMYGLAYRRPGIIDPLREHGPVVGVVRQDAPEPNETLAYLVAQPGAAPPVPGRLSTMVLLPPLPPQPAPRLGPTLPVSAVRVSADQDHIAALFDGDLRTRWNTGLQLQDDEVVADLGERRAVGAVELDHGPFAVSYPRQIEVSISVDGAAWRVVVARTPVEALVVRGVLRDPVRVPLVLITPAAEGRFVRVRQTGRHPEYSWSIAELAIHGPATDVVAGRLRACKPREGSGRRGRGRTRAPEPARRRPPCAICVAPKC